MALRGMGRGADAAAMLATLGPARPGDEVADAWVGWRTDGDRPAAREVVRRLSGERLAPGVRLMHRALRERLEG